MKSFGSIFCVLSLVMPLYGAERVLYDGTTAQSPTSAGWTLITDPLFGAQVTETPGAVGVTLDSTVAISDKGGYFSNAISSPAIVLDRDVGFTLRWRALVSAETHLTNDRAGFNVLVVCSDLMALELAHWENEVWAQDGPPNTFTHAEGATVNTTSLREYELIVQGDTYALNVDGGEVLTGNLRDYSSFDPGLPINPYTTPNMIFLGDDTGSASASVRIDYISLDAPTPLLYDDPAGDSELMLGLNAGGDTLEIRNSMGDLITSGAVSDHNAIVINGGSGDDVLTVDFANGSPIPSGGLTFNGGGQSTVGDTLRIINEAAARIDFDHVNGSDGSIDLDGAIITYTGLEPVDMSGSTANNFYFNFPATDDNIEITSLGGTTNRMASADVVPTFESTDFVRPTGTLNIDGGGGVDTLTIVDDFANGRHNVTTETFITTGFYQFNNATLSANDVFINPTNDIASETITLGANARALISGNLQLGGLIGTNNFRGNVNQSGVGSQMLIEGDLVFGGAAGAEGGTYDLNNGELIVNGSVVETTADVDNAQFQLNNGSASVLGDITVQRFSVGQGSNADFVYDIRTNQAVTSTGSTVIGSNGKGFLTVTNTGASLTSLNLTVGENASSSGRVYYASDELWNIDAYIRIGHNGTGHVHMASGTMNAGATAGGTKGIRLAETASGIGTFTIGSPGGSGVSDPIVNAEFGNFETANSGRGEVIMHHGTVNQLSNNIIVGQNVGSSGSWTIMDGLVRSANQLRVGNSGTGMVRQVAGTVEIGTTLDLGNVRNVGARGTYLMEGGLLTTSNGMFVGNVAEGFFELDDGQVDVGTVLRIGNGAEGQGTMIMRGGVLNVGTRLADNMVIANAGTNTTEGTAHIIDGEVNIARSFRIAENTGSTGTLVVGSADGSTTPVINLNTGNGGNFEAADAGTGTFIFYSGVIVQNTNNFITGQAIGSSATVQVGGSPSEARLELTGGSGSIDWNVNGGGGDVSVLSNGVVNVGRDLNMGNNADANSGLVLDIDGGVVRLGAGGFIGNLNYRNNGPRDQINLVNGMLASNRGAMNFFDTNGTNFNFRGGILADFRNISNGDFIQNGGLLRIGDTNEISQMFINTTRDFIQSAGVLEIDILGAGGLDATNGHDRLVVSGDVTLGGTLQIVGDYVAAPGETFTIIQNNGPNVITGTFSGLAEGAAFNAGSSAYTISYTGGNGNEVVLTAIEPSPDLFVQLPVPEGDDVRLFFTGAPNTTYTVQFADNTVFVPWLWQDLGDVTSGPDGTFNVLRTPATVSEVYRAIQRP